MWMLRFAQHDKLGMANLTLLSLSLQKERDVCTSRQGKVALSFRTPARNPVGGCFTSFSMTEWVIARIFLLVPSMLFCVIPSIARNPSVDNFGRAVLSVFTSLAVLVAVLPERFQMARQSASTNWRFWS